MLSLWATVGKLLGKLPQLIRKRVTLLLITGTITSGVGLLLLLSLSSLVRMGLKSQMQLKEGNTITNNWMDVPLAIAIKVHVFSIQNVKQFVSGAKPVLRELGPYYWKWVVIWKYRTCLIIHIVMKSASLERSDRLGRQSRDSNLLGATVIQFRCPTNERKTKRQSGCH